MNKYKNLFFVFFIFVFLFIFVRSSLSQVLPSTDEGATAAAEQRRMQEKTLEEKVAKMQKVEVQKEEVMPKEQELPPEAYKEFRVNYIEIQDCTAFSAKQILKVFYPLSEKEYNRLKELEPKEEKEEVKEGESKETALKEEAKEEVLEEGTKEEAKEEAEPQEQVKEGEGEKKEEKLEQEKPKQKKSKTKKIKTKQPLIPLKLRPLIVKEKRHPKDKIILTYNRNLSLKDLLDIAKRITALYAGNGYFTSQAFVPPQEVKEGYAIIKVFEGKWGDVIVDKGRYYKNRIVAEKFRPYKGKIFKYSDLTKGLTDLNANPDRSVKSIMLPSRNYGYSDIKITMTEKRPYHVKFQIDNTGSKSTGHQKYYWYLLHNNLTRNDDILSYKYNCSDNSNSEGHTLNYSIPFNYYLSEFSYSGSYSRTRLTGASEDLLAGGDSYTVSFSVNHRFFATPKWEFSGKLGFDAKRSTTDMMSTLVYKDSLRILNTSFTLTESDGKGTTSIVNAGYFGFCDFMGASSRNNPLSSKFPANGQFVKYTGSVTRYHIIPFSSTLTVSGDIQLTPDNLTSLEQYSLGGAGSIRGYPPSEYTSDYGWKVITEIKSPFFILPKWALPANLNRDSVFSLVTFFDFGKGYLRNPAATARTDRVLKSAGVGLRCYLFNNDLSMSADFAWPLGPKPTDKLEGGRVHYSVTWEF